MIYHINYITFHYVALQYIPFHSVPCHVLPWQCITHWTLHSTHYTIGCISTYAHTYIHTSTHACIYRYLSMCIYAALKSKWWGSKLLLTNVKTFVSGLTQGWFTSELKGFLWTFLQPYLWNHVQQMVWACESLREPAIEEVITLGQSTLYCIIPGLGCFQHMGTLWGAQTSNFWRGFWGQHVAAHP